MQLQVKLLLHFTLWSPLNNEKKSTRGFIITKIS